MYFIVRTETSGIPLIDGHEARFLKNNRYSCTSRVTQPLPPK